MDIKRKLFFMIISLFLFIFFIKQKNEMNYEVYYEIKIISNLRDTMNTYCIMIYEINTLWKE